MRAVVLVGGEGTRLRPLTYAMPKQMLPIVEVPMIERVVGRLVQSGITDVVLSLGYRPDAFLEAYPDSTCAGATVRYVVEDEPLDTAGAIRFAATEAGIDDTFVVLNGDVLTDFDVGALVAFHGERGGAGAIHLTPVDDPSAFGVVPTDDSGRVQAFIEKPPPGTAPTNYINAGAYVLDASVLDRIPGGRRVSIERETFPALVADGALYALQDDSYWLDTGTPEKYLQANLDLLSGVRSGLPAPAAVEACPGLWTIGTPTILGEAGQGTLVGAAATVGPGAWVETAVVGAGSEVHSGARVVRSVLLPGVVVHEGATVTDALLGPGAVVGKGATVAELSVLGAGATCDGGEELRGEKRPAPG